MMMGQQINLLLSSMITHPLVLLVANLSFQSVKAEDDYDYESLLQCEPGLILPVWKPETELSVGDRFTRGLVYLLLMIYLSIGVVILSYRLMSSVEVITSKKIEINTKQTNGENKTVVLRFWTDTLLNWLLLALGLSAPDIFFSIIGIYVNNFESGDLGPGNVVSYAALNIFVIIGICVFVIPDGQVKKINNLRVFLVAAIWSLFAYMWLVVVLRLITPGIVDVWEGVITVFIGILTVITAYIADRRLLIFKYLPRETETDINIESCECALLDVPHQLDQVRQDCTSILKGLTNKHPNMDAEQLEAMATDAMLDKGPMSREFYLMQAQGKFNGIKNVFENPENLPFEVNTENLEENAVNKLVERVNASMVMRTLSWKEQFIEALSVSADGSTNGDVDESNGNSRSCGDYIVHFLTIFWKILFAFVPPTGICDGYLTFVVTVCCIGVLTAFIGDMSSHLGCTIGIKDSISVMIFVTSFPRICVIKKAAFQYKFADAPIWIVIGINAVYVFVCIGVSWTLAAIYLGFLKPITHPGCIYVPEAICGKFSVDPGSLAYSVTIFCPLALVAILVLMLRRHTRIGGELGGPKRYKYATSAFLFCLWLIHTIWTSLEAYGFVQGF